MVVYFGRLAVDFDAFDAVPERGAAFLRLVEGLLCSAECKEFAVIPLAMMLPPLFAAICGTKVSEIDFW